MNLRELAVAIVEFRAPVWVIGVFLLIAIVLARLLMS